MCIVFRGYVTANPTSFRQVRSVEFLVLVVLEEIPVVRFAAFTRLWATSEHLALAYRNNLLQICSSDCTVSQRRKTKCL
jgi:hypothetical protein